MFKYFLNIFFLTIIWHNSFATGVLDMVGGPAAVSMRESINRVCGRAIEAPMNETLFCPASVKSDLISLVHSRNESVVNSVSGFVSQLPFAARGLLHEICASLESDLTRYLSCWNDNAVSELWKALDMDSYVSSGDPNRCTSTESDRPPRFISTLTNPAQVEACKTFSNHINSLRTRYKNVKSQLIVRSSASVACSIASGNGRIAKRDEGSGVRYFFNGDFAADCFPTLPDNSLNIPMPYAPVSPTSVPGGGNDLQDELSSSRYGLWESPEDNSSTSLCSIAFNMAQSGRYRTSLSVDDEICPNMPEYDPNRGFYEDISMILSRIEAADYYELLRLEALSRTVRAARIELGDESVKEIPEKCSNIESGYRASLDSPLTSTERQRQAYTSSQDYNLAIKSAAVRIKSEYYPEIQRLKSEIADYQSKLNLMYMSLGQDARVLGRNTQGIVQQISVLQREIHAREQRVSQIEALINADFSRYPILMLDRDHSSKVWENNPYVDEIADSSNINSIVARGREKLKEETLEQIESICDQSQISLGDLLRDKNLSSIVLHKYPRFKNLHQCHIDQMESNESMARVLKFGAGLACAGLGPVGGAICGSVVAIGGGYLDYEKAQRRLSFQGQCRLAMGNYEGRCESEEYLKAQEDFNNALQTLAIDGAIEILLPVSISSLKYLSPSQIKSFKAAVEGAQSQDDIRRIAHQIEEAAEETRSQVSRLKETRPDDVFVTQDLSNPISKPLNGLDESITPITLPDGGTLPLRSPRLSAERVHAASIRNEPVKGISDTGVTFDLRGPGRLGGDTPDTFNLNDKGGISTTNPTFTFQTSSTRSLDTGVTITGQTGSQTGITLTGQTGVRTGVRNGGRQLAERSFRQRSDVRLIRGKTPTPGSPISSRYEVTFPEIHYQSVANPVSRAQDYLNSPDFLANYQGMSSGRFILDDATELGRGGTRRVFNIEGNDDYVVKVYDSTLPGMRSMSEEQRGRYISGLIQRELALEDVFLQVIDDYRKAGLEPPFRVARINRDPELLKRGIIIQERFSGQTTNTLTREQLDALSPTPPGYKPPASEAVQYRSRTVMVDEHGEFLTRGGVSHRELTRIPGIRAYQDFLDQYDNEIIDLVSDRYGFTLGSKGGPSVLRRYGMDTGNGYGNTMLDPDGGPRGSPQIVIYDW